MHAAERPELFAPAAAPALLRSLLLAIVVHALLIAALTWGVNWKRQAQTLTVEAELWAALPQEEAPPPLEPPPQVEPITPPLALKAEAALPSEADIALAREKERKLKAQEEEERLAREKAAKLEQEKLAQEKKKKLEQDKKLAQEKKKEKEKEAKLKAQKEAEQIKKMRDDQMKRMMGLAGSGSADSKGKGKDAKTAGPSAGYAGRIRARIKPNIVFTDNISSNPTTEVEVRTSPDGTIVGRKIIKSSGVKSWDDAVLKAIDKTEVLPRDEDGQVPSPLVITFRPRD